MSYWVAVVTRNGANHLTRTLDSILDQTEKPTRITVVDDGSTDDTPKILQKYRELNKSVIALTKPDRGYDIRRVPANINLACKRGADTEATYFMISGDDCIYPSNYSQSLTASFDSTPLLVVASGRPSTGSREHSPSGSGRMIRASFWRDMGGAYPLKAGWETWLLYKAREKGFQVRLFDDLTYEHARPRGTEHQFVYWGAAMGTLGYDPLYALGRIAKNLFVRSVSVRGTVNMLRGYFAAELGSDDPFMSRFDKSLREFVKRGQQRRIAKIAARLI